MKKNKSGDILLEEKIERMTKKVICGWLKRLVGLLLALGMVYGLKDNIPLLIRAVVSIVESQKSEKSVPEKPVKKEKRKGKR